MRNICSILLVHHIQGSINGILCFTIKVWECLCARCCYHMVITTSAFNTKAVLIATMLFSDFCSAADTRLFSLSLFFLNSRPNYHPDKVIRMFYSSKDCLINCGFFVLQEELCFANSFLFGCRKCNLQPVFSDYSIMYKFKISYKYHSGIYH